MASSKRTENDKLLLKCLGKALRERREDLGMTAMGVAKRAETTDTAIMEAERGQRDIRVSTLAKAAKALNCTQADLLRTAEFLFRVMSTQPMVGVSPGSFLERAEKELVK